MIACLQGGAGNQLFQYAMARAASLKLGAPLYVNTTRFDQCWIGRRYSLSLWNTKISGIRNEEPNLIKEQGLPYNPSIVNNIHAHSTLVGYWQTEKYFSDIAELLREEFTPSTPMTPHGIDIQGQIKEAGYRSVFLTIRRTDYVTSDFHGLLGIDYYLAALKLIAEKTDPVVFVFSDEPEWCRLNLRLPYPTIIGGNFDRTTRYHLGREDEELTLMSQCRHAICANSSYSWWGAWLNPELDRIVITPKKWFNSGEEDPRDIVPERWLRV